MGRTCTNCNIWKDISEYYSHERTNTNEEKYMYYNPQCKACLIEKANKWHKENADKKSAYGKRYYYDNKDMHRESNLKWREKGGLREWQKNNTDKVKEYRLNREENKSHEISNEEWSLCKEYFNYTCAYCGITEDDAKKLYGNVLHREHVDHEGANDLSNCVPACKSCNSSKHTGDMETWYKAKELIFNEERFLRITNWLKDNYKKYIDNPINFNF